MERQNSQLTLIKIYFAYNSWATAQLIRSLEKLSETELTAPGCSGHGSIRKTLAHLLGTQWGWFSWFDKSKTAQESMGLRLSSAEIEHKKDLIRKWEEIDWQTTRCLQNLTDADVNEDWSAATPGGFNMTLPLWQLLLHVANHGTHTRAQIVAAIRRFGHEPGIYEFFRFALGQAKS